MENREVSTQPKPRITPEQYLALERKAERRSEYLDGEMFLMSGATLEHIQIVRNLTFELTLQLKDRPCEVLPTEMRTKVSQTGLYTYPDLAVICCKPEFEDEHFDTLTNPMLIIEVLSESTESYDRGRKFAHYRSIGTLKEYVLVSQWECRIERFVRGESDAWTYTECTDPNGSIELESAACRLSVAGIYHRVDFQRAQH